MGKAEENISKKVLWDCIEESLHDAMQYTLIKDIHGAIEKAEEAAADLRIFLMRGEKNGK